MTRKAYPSDVTNEEWEILKKLLPSAQATGRPRKSGFTRDHKWNILRATIRLFLAGDAP